MASEGSAPSRRPRIAATAASVSPAAKSSAARARRNGAGSAAAAISRSSSARAASGPADVVEEAHEGQRPIRRGAGRRPRPAGPTAAPPRPASGSPWPRCHCTSAARIAAFSGKSATIASELVAGAGRVAERLERGEPGEVQPLVVGRMDEGGVDACQRLGRFAGGQPVGDEHHLRRHRAGGLGDHAFRHRHRRGAAVVAAAEVDGGLQRPHLGVGGRQRVGHGNVQARRCRSRRSRGRARPPAAGPRACFGSCSTRRSSWLSASRVLAALAQQLGIGEPRRGMVCIEPEDVAELEHRPRRRRPRRAAPAPAGSAPRRVPPGCRSRRAPAGRRAAGSLRRGGGRQAGAGDGPKGTRGKPAARPVIGTGAHRALRVTRIPRGTRGGPRRAREHRASATRARSGDRVNL